MPPGKGEEDNELVFEWGTEARKMATGEGEYAWHDDIAASFGGYKTEEASSIRRESRVRSIAIVSHSYSFVRSFDGPTDRLH